MKNSVSITITIDYKFVIDYRMIYHRVEISLCDIQYNIKCHLTVLVKSYFTYFKFLKFDQKINFLRISCTKFSPKILVL